VIEILFGAAESQSRGNPAEPVQGIFALAQQVRTAKAWRLAWQGEGLSCVFFARMDGFSVNQVDALVVCFAIRT
jgi:hypothetical protein